MMWRLGLFLAAPAAAQAAEVAPAPAAQHVDTAALDAKDQGLGAAADSTKIEKRESGVTEAAAATVLEGKAAPEQTVEQEQTASLDTELESAVDPNPSPTRWCDIFFYFGIKYHLLLKVLECYSFIVYVVKVSLKLLLVML